MEVQVQRSVLPQLNLTVDYVTSGSALSGAQPSAPPPPQKKNLPEKGAETSPLLPPSISQLLSQDPVASKEPVGLSGQRPSH